MGRALQETDGEEGDEERTRSTLIAGRQFFLF